MSTDGDNVLTGNSGANIIVAGGGADTLDGGSGNDTLFGGTQNDIYEFDKIVGTIATRYETPIIACAASSESVFDQTSSYLFGTLSPNVGLFGPMVKYFREKMPQLKKVAVLGRDDVFPKSTAQGISAAAKAAGLV